MVVWNKRIVFEEYRQLFRNHKEGAEVPWRIIHRPFRFEDYCRACLVAHMSWRSIRQRHVHAGHTHSTATRLLIDSLDTDVTDPLYLPTLFYCL